MDLSNKKYISLVEKSGIFDNSFADAYPQTVVADMVRKHIYSDNSSRKKRVLIYGLTERVPTVLHILFLKRKSLQEANTVLLNS